MTQTAPANRRRIAIASILPLLAAVFALTVVTRPAQAEVVPASGAATWGIRDSYVNYITGPIAHGEATPRDGATAVGGAEKGPWSFPVADATFDAATRTGEITFDGAVYTGGHDYDDGYILEAEWSNLRLAIDGDTGILRADLTYRPFVGADPNVPKPDEELATDVDFAEIDLSGVDWAPDGSGNRTITAAPATGIEEAMTLIGWDQFYSAEMPNPALAPLSVTFREATDTSTTTTTGPSTSSTSTTTTAPTTTTTAPTTTTTPVEAGEAEVTGGNLSWGVYRNFVNYVTGPIANGSITTGGGATGAPKGPYGFPAVKGQTLDITATNVDIAFTGSVRFVGHQHGTSPPALEMTFSNIRVEKRGTKGRLVADVLSRPFVDLNTVSELVETPNAYLAELDFSQAQVGRIGDGAGWLDVPAKVAPGGSHHFGDFYEDGQPLDPLTIRLALSEIPDDLGDATAPPPVAGPTVTLSTTTVAPGGVIAITSSGFTPNEQIEVWMHSTPTFLQTVRADATGAVQATITIPTNAPAGEHRLELRGISSGLSAFSPTFRVVGSGSGVGSSTGRLSRTGSDSGTPLRVAAVLLLAGGGLVVLARRRRTTTA